MNQIRLISLVFAITAPALASAQTMNFEAAAALLGASCGKDIDENCRGVNLDPLRMKECLGRNRDVMTPKCRDDYPRAFDAILQRIKARAAVAKMCEHEAQKLCAAAPREDAGKLQCLLTATRGVSVKCSQAITAAGYR